MAGNGDSVETKKPLMQDLSADNEDQDVTQIESLCLNCHEQGMTRLLLTKIPFFREVILSSFSCDECGHMDTSIQSAGRIQDKGVRITLEVTKKEDLDRQVVKSNSAIFALPFLEFEQEPTSDKGEITTVEGLLSGVTTGLTMLQDQRREQTPEVAKKIDEFIAKVEALKDVESPFELILDDPSGNSYIENPVAPKKDEHLKTAHYDRTLDQDRRLGIAADEGAGFSSDEEDEEEEAGPLTNPEQEVLTFRTNCSHCNAPCDTNMKMVDIPFFKKVVIMATVCDGCGARDNEVKSGAGIEDKGTRIELHITDTSDLNRDILKSDMCAVRIPALELELTEGTLGGRFTTIEGLLNNIHEQLSDKNNPFSIGMVGDSSQPERRGKFDGFIEKLNQLRSGEMMDVMFILDDPSGNSYIQNVYAPDDDPEMKIVHYERDYDQNELLGLNDMRTENYDES